MQDSVGGTLRYYRNDFCKRRGRRRLPRAMLKTMLTRLAKAEKRAQPDSGPFGVLYVDPDAYPTEADQDAFIERRFAEMHAEGFGMVLAIQFVSPTARVDTDVETQTHSEETPPMLKTQHRRAAALEEQLIPADHVTIYTGVPRDPEYGREHTGSGSGFSVWTSPDEEQAAAAARTTALPSDDVEEEDEAFVIEFVEPEPQPEAEQPAPAPIAAPAAPVTPPAPAPAPNTWQSTYGRPPGSLPLPPAPPAIHREPYASLGRRGSRQGRQYGWMR